MTSRAAWLLAAWTTTVTAACATPAQKATAGPSDLGNFDCSSRRAEYMVVGGFAAHEAGISLNCEGNRPLVTSWKQNPGQPRSETEHPLSPGEFESTWEQVDSTGWRYLEATCPGSDPSPGEPVYVIDVGDHAVSVNLTCAGKELPFPYDRLVNELDLRAAGFQ